VSPTRAWAVSGPAPFVIAAGIVLALLFAAGSVAATQRVCKLPTYPGEGYFTSLTVRQTTCATGKRLVLAYYRCRTENGPTGRCKRSVLGYRCSERRNTIPTQISARVTCTAGRKVITHSYQQNT
jgi:hypothetical protein